MSESAEAMDYVSSSTVEAQYELFNKELGLDTKDNSGNPDTQEKTDQSVVTGEDSEVKLSAADEGTTKESEEKEEEKEDEAEEPDSDDEEVEDEIDEWDGEDPSEAEVAQFCQPSEQLILSEFAEQPKKRRVVLYPVKLGELGHPSLIEVMKTCLEFKTLFAQSKLNVADETEDFSFYGVVEFVCKSSVAALEAVETLKSIREDVNVRIMEPAETANKLMQNWATASTSSASVIQNLVVVKPLSKEVTTEQIRNLFPDATDIVITQPKSFPRLAYVCYEESSSVDEVVNKYKVDRPVIGDRRLMVLKYQPPKLPPGFLKMERRYRILLQIKKLEKALKNKKASYVDSQRKKMQSTVEHCTSLIEKDDASRNELGLKTMTLKELRRIRKIREAVKPETIWLPRLPGDKREELGRSEMGDDDDNDYSKERKNEPKRPKRFDSNRPSSQTQGRWSSSSGVPSLLSIEMEEPVSRVRANQLAALSSLLPFGFGGMRGGMMRGRGGFRGRFMRGRGYFDEDMGPDFGPPGGLFGLRRGGRRGGFGKRPRQDSEMGFQDSGLDGSVVEDVSDQTESFQEPAGKMAKAGPVQNWSSDSRDDAKPASQLTRMQSDSLNTGRGGKLGGWSKSSSAISPRGSGFRQGGFQRGGGLVPGFSRGGYSQGGVGGGFNQGGDSGGFNQGSGGGGFDQGGGSGGFDQGGDAGGFNQGVGSGGYSQVGSGGGFNQAGGGEGFTQGGGAVGGFNQGGSGGYGPASEGFNQGIAGGYNQGNSSSYGSANVGGFNQANLNEGNIGFNQSAVGSYNTAGGGYNPSTPAFTQGASYNQSQAVYNQSQAGYQQNSESYGSQNTGYGYNYSTPDASAGSGYPAAQAQMQSMTPQQSWTVPNAPGQNYWQQSAQGNWQQPTNTATGQMGQSSDQSAYNYGWNTWK